MKAISAAVTGRLCLRALSLCGAIIVATPAFCWSGFDYEKGAHVEIESGNLVRPGRDIEIYDYSTGEYKDVEVQSIRSYGSSVEVEVYDSASGEYRTLDMDSN